MMKPGEHLNLDRATCYIIVQPEKLVGPTRSACSSPDTSSTLFAPSATYRALNTCFQDPITLVSAFTVAFSNCI